MPALTNRCPKPEGNEPWEEIEKRREEEKKRQRWREEESRRQQADLDWQRAGLDERHRKFILEDQPLKKNAAWYDAYLKIQKILLRGGTAVILGDRGNGKTQAAACLIRWATLQGHDAQYLRCREVGINVRSSYNGAGNTEKNIIHTFTDVWLLVLDECQEKFDSIHELRTLTLIMDKRYGAMRPTILIANTTEAEFKLIMGASIVDRIREDGGLVPFDWSSFRGKTQEAKP